eukprot:UN01712
MFKTKSTTHKVAKKPNVAKAHKHKAKVHTKQRKTVTTTTLKKNKNMASELTSSARSFKPLFESQTTNFVPPFNMAFHRHFAAAPQQQQKNVNSRDGEPGNISLEINHVTKKLDSGRVLFQDINTSFYHGAKIGILGKNGAGKSSLLKILAQVDKNIEGSVDIAPGKKLGYLAQEPVLDDDKTVMENVLLGVKEKADLLKRYDEISDEFGAEDADFDKLIDEQAEVQAKIEEHDCWHLHREIAVALEALCCPPPDHMVGDCSGGQKRRVALAKLLLSKPDILLLDEPTNHLDSGSVQWLEQYLSAYPGLVVAITHDRYFLDNVAGYILEIENGRFFPFKGNYTAWLAAKQRRQELEAAHSKALDKNLEKEMEWMNANAKGRQSKGKSRVRKIEELQQQKEQYRRNRLESGSLVIPSGPRLGGKVIDVKDLALAYNHKAAHNTVLTPQEVEEMQARGEEVPWVFRNVNFYVEPGQVVGIVGPNGIGKT